ncbi:MAG: PAS domain S-box protein [Magnetococcales bacterium]|nr:PAS domain S-box protein [Magnetococcales bacterium]
MNKLPITKRLSFRLARIGVAVAFLLGLILSIVQVVRDYTIQTDALDAHIQRILDVATHPATRSVHILDRDLAREVVQGLLEYDFINAGQILDDLGLELSAKHRQELVNVEQRWLSGFFSGGIIKYERRLHPPGVPMDKPGRLIVEVDRDVALSDFVSRAIFVIISGVLRNLLLVLLLFSAYHMVLTRPLIRQSKNLAAMDPLNPQPLPLIDNHVHDELGVLTQVTNQFLSDSAKHLSAQHELEIYLRESEEKFRVFFHQAVMGLVIAGMDKKFVDVNHAFCQMVGYDRDELLNMTFENITHPDDLKKDLQNLRHVISGQIDSFTMEKRYLHRSGSIVWGLLSVSLVRDEAGDPRLFIGQIQNISAQKKILEQLRINEEQLRRYFELGLIGIATTTIEKGWLEVNDRLCEIFGYSKQELSSKTWAELTHPDDLEADLTEFNRIIDGISNGYSMDKRFIHKNGEVIHAIISVSCMRKSDHSIDYFIAFIKNISERKQAEDKLLRTSKRLSIATRAGGIGVWEWNLADNQLIWDHQMMEIYHVDKNEFTGHYQAWKNQVHPDDLLPTEALINSALAGDIEFDTEFRIIWPDGSVRHVRSAGLVNYSTRGLPESMVGVNWDITILRHAEQSIRNNEERFRALADFSPIGIFQASPEGKGIYVNKRWSEISHFSSEKTLGEGWINAIHPEDRQRTVESWQHVVANKEPWAEQSRIIRPDGEVRWVEFQAFPELNSQGALVSYVGSVVDHTEEKNIVLALKESEDRLINSERMFRSLVEQAYAIFWRFDLDADQFTYMSPQSEVLLGYAIDSWTDLDSWKARIYPDDREWASQYCIARTARGQDHTLEYRAVTKSGRVVWIRDVVTVVTDQKGMPAEMLGIMFDVTKTKEAETNLRSAKREAEKANQAKSIFLATMSHEIRTPLNAILGMGEVLNETELTETQKWSVDTLNRSGEVLLSLINDVLDLSKIEAGQLILEKATFDLHLLVREAVNIFEFTAREKGIVLDLQIDDEVPCWVEGDSTRLRQMLLNLIGNALKFTQKGAISIRLGSSMEDKIFFSVEDTGLGISQAHQEEIFKPFTQADASTTRKHGGTGLGLTICQRLVDLMDGKIWVESTLDQGSTFTFLIPLPASSAMPVGPDTLNQDKNAIKHNGQTVDSPTIDSQNPQKILLVDDADDNRLLVQAFLKKSAYQLVMATNGADAVEKFKSESFDFVLMDIQMPVMDGYQATQAIRAWENQQGHNPTPVIALTAHALSEESEQIKASGCDLHLTKPIKKKLLLATLRDYMG